jgi:hypothetical protein
MCGRCPSRVSFVGPTSFATRRAVPTRVLTVSFFRIPWQALARNLASPSIRDLRFNQLSIKATRYESQRRLMPIIKADEFLAQSIFASRSKNQAFAQWLGSGIRRFMWPLTVALLTAGLAHTT